MGTGNSVRALRRKYGSKFVYVLNMLKVKGLRVKVESNGGLICESKTKPKIVRVTND